MGVSKVPEPVPEKGRETPTRRADRRLRPALRPSSRTRDFIREGGMERRSPDRHRSPHRSPQGSETLTRDPPRGAAHDEDGAIRDGAIRPRERETETTPSRIYGRILPAMATMTIKSTYSLDVGTVRTLEGLARRWNVSKSEALRRAIRSEAERQPSRADARLQALRALQASVAARGVDLDGWERQTKEIRSVSFPRLAGEPR